MNPRQGFTIVELLIVIAIIGILASVVIRSLNDARVSGIDAKIISEMSVLSKRASADESINLTYDSTCGSNGVTQSTQIQTLITSIEDFSLAPVVCNSDTYAYAVSVPLSTDYWCVDSSGVSRSIPTQLQTSPPDLVCP